MFKLWNEAIPFPEFSDLEYVKGIKYTVPHTAIDGEYQFLLGTAVIKFNGKIYMSWGNSWRDENDDNTVLAEKISYDGGKTFENYRIISKKTENLGRSHGVYFTYCDKLYAFCPVATYGNGKYPDIKAEAYVLNDSGEYDYLGIVNDDEFWPLCEPIILDDGTLLMAGLRANVNSEFSYGKPAVALCDGKNILKWTVSDIGDSEGLNKWGETTVIKENGYLLALIRRGKGIETLVSRSFDNGKTWNDVEKSNFPSRDSKLYAGRLSNGKKYLIFNMNGRGYRDTLAIAVGNELFEKIYIIRDGFSAPPKYWKFNEWSYPYAVEDKDTNELIVVYSKNKEDCELARLPIENL